MALIGEGKIKILWGFIVLIGAIMTHLISGHTTDAYPYLILWAILVVSGLIITAKIPHAHRQRETLISFMWIVLAAIGLLLTYWVAEAVIEAPFVFVRTIPAPLIFLLKFDLKSDIMNFIDTPKNKFHKQNNFNFQLFVQFSTFRTLNRTHITNFFIWTTFNKSSTTFAFDYFFKIFILHQLAPTFYLLLFLYYFYQYL